MKGLDHLLSAVSRSFYLSMRFLPREMRSGVAVGYLLARATDTVADAVDMDCRERLALLRMMGETVAGAASREVAATCFGRLGVLSTIQTHRGTSPHGCTNAKTCTPTHSPENVMTSAHRKATGKFAACMKNKKQRLLPPFLAEVRQKKPTQRVGFFS